MELRSVPVQILRSVNPAALEWPSEARASEEDAVGSSIVALSWLGCIPVISCRGSSLGDSHEY